MTADLTPTDIIAEALAAFETDYFHDWRPAAEHVLSRLVQAGHTIVPSEMKSTQWLRVLTKDGSLWCETSDEDEANAAAAAIGQPVQRLYRSSAPAEWRTLAATATIKDQP